MTTEIDKKVYELYLVVNYSDDQLYAYYDFKSFIFHRKDMWFEKYYNDAIIQLRIDKLKNLNNL